MVIEQEFPVTSNNKYGSKFVAGGNFIIPLVKEEKKGCIIIANF